MDFSQVMEIGDMGKCSPFCFCPIGDWITGLQTHRRHPGRKWHLRHTQSHRPICRTADAARSAKEDEGQASCTILDTNAYVISAATAFPGPTLSSSSSSSFSPAALLRCRLEGRDQIVDTLLRRHRWSIINNHVYSSCEWWHAITFTFA